MTYKAKFKVWRGDDADGGLHDFTVEVNDGEGNSVLTLPFATVDPTLDHLQPELRQLIERLSESQRQLAETMFSSEALMYYERATAARWSGRPYLAARFGQRVDTPLRL